MATYVANKRNTANITHIFWYDASVPAFSPNLMHAALPYNLLPVVPAVGDIVYFGINTAWVDSGPFCSLVFDIGTAQVDLTIAWEYSAGWAALTVQDNTDAGGLMTGQAFDTTGENSVHWQHPGAWATAVVNGVTGYWVRARVTGIGAAPSPPTQQNSDVYSIVWPYVEAQADAIGGDIPAMAGFTMTNESFTTAGAGDLHFSRVLCGLRSYDRGDNFSAYLNFADEQNPPDVSVTAAGLSGGTIDPDITTPTGRRCTWTSGGVSALAFRFGIIIDPPTLTDFYGTYHVFFRGRQVGGAAGDIEIQLTFDATMPVTGVVYTMFTTPLVAFDSVNDWQVLDFGKVTIPSTVLNTSRPLGGLRIGVYASNTNAAAPNMYGYDLILLPVDEWAADYAPPTYAGGSRFEWGEYLDVDTFDYKVGHRSIVRDSMANDYVRIIYSPLSNGPTILQANSRQRLWFFGMVRSIATPWAAKPYHGHIVAVSKNQRYITMRGTR